MVSVRPHAEDMSMPADETLETSPQLRDPCPEDHGNIERESPSQPPVNVSQDMRLIVASVKPQVCPALSLSKFLADAISSEEYSQAPTSNAQAASSQQPSPEFLMSLGVKVRDFAYESTLPAIVPVPRVPRQVQPAVRAPKRAQRDWDDKEGSTSSAQLLLGPAESKKLRSLERKPTEPLLEPVVQHTRTLERITKRLCSIIAPAPPTLPTTPRARLSASPPILLITPPLSHLESSESELVQTPSAFPFVVHVDDTSAVPASQLDSASQPPPFHSILYTRFPLDSLLSPGYTPVPSPPQNAPPAPVMSPLRELPPSTKEPRSNLRGRKRRGIAGTPPPHRYQLRQRPTPSSRPSSLSRCSRQANSTLESHPQQTHRLR